MLMDSIIMLLALFALSIFAFSFINAQICIYLILKVKFFEDFKQRLNKLQILCRQSQCFATAN